MKKVSKIIKSNYKFVAGAIIGAALTGGTAYAATILLNSNQVGFDNTGTSLSSTDVQGALDELYQKAKILDNLPLMQTFNKSSLANVGDSATLIDARDGEKYTVKKLADGKVWMTENLRLINKTISNADSNLPAGETWTIPASSVSGFSAQNTNNAYLDSTYGGYYSFYTATAGWGTNSVTSGNSPKDICPKGWRLPTGGSTGEFNTLYGQYNSYALMMGEPNFTLSGNVRNSSVSDQGSRGRFLSSTVRDANLAYYFLYSSNSVNPASSERKYYGFSVRCMAVQLASVLPFPKTSELERTFLIFPHPCDIIQSMITKENKEKAIAKTARSKKDVGSPEVQVSILTERIKEVTEHVKNNKHDFMARRGLMQMVGRRKKLLKYLEKTNFELYKETVAKLGLRK